MIKGLITFNEIIILMIGGLVAITGILSFKFNWIISIVLTALGFHVIIDNLRNLMRDY